jgi:restriction system protein
MKWAMNENSLFAILLRSAWWVSFAIGVAVSALAVSFMPETYRVFGIVTGIPFIVIGCIAAWKQFQAPSTSRIDRTLTAVRAMNWGDFAGVVEEAYRRDGYEVSRVASPAADFEMKKEWRTFLVSGKRWKVAQTGVEPLRDLQAAKEAREAHECIYIATGVITDNARRFAAEKKIRLVDGSELARLLPRVGR